MAKIQLSFVFMILLGCKSPELALQNNSQSKAYIEQKENIEKGIYFRAGAEHPRWNMKISDTYIEFDSEKDSFTMFHTLASNTNLKSYHLQTDKRKITIEQLSQPCNSQLNMDYSVRIELQSGSKKSKIFQGCGKYITDFRLHDIWALKKLNSNNINASDFNNSLPILEINSSKNSFLGKSGCKQISGSFICEKQLLRFTDIVKSNENCVANDKEVEYLKTLGQISSYHLESNQLILNGEMGKVLVFKKVD